MIPILYHDYFTQTGADHLRRSCGNEDRVSVQSRRDLTVAVICDGAGSFRSGAAAASLTAEKLCSFLSENFDTLYQSLSSSVLSSVIRIVEESLSAYSAETGVESHALACTILAAAVHEDGRCICFHLGDGIILQKNGAEDVPSVVSCPMTGLAPHSTYLTMNCDLQRYLRFYRWECPSLSHILLLSDGAAEHLVRLSGGAGWVYDAPGSFSIPQMRALLSAAEPRDDHSGVLIHRTGSPHT